MACDETCLRCAEALRAVLFLQAGSRALGGIASPAVGRGCAEGAGEGGTAVCTKSSQAKRTTYQPAADESYTEFSSPRKIFVCRSSGGMLCFRGVSWLLLCTSKEVTRSATGRAEALALEDQLPATPGGLRSTSAACPCRC